MAEYQLKDSGVEWFGNTPTHWKKDKLFRLCDKMGSGGTPTSTNESYYGGSIPWIQSGDLTDLYVTKTSKMITEEALQNSSAKMFSKGTLLIAMYGATIGKLGIMEMDAATNQACCALQVSQKLYPKFTYYLMLASRNYLLNEAYGGGQPNISQETLKQLYLVIPKTKEQKAIADYLDKACKQIDKTLGIKQQQLEKLESYRKSIIHEAVTKGLDKNVTLKDSGVEWLGDIPEHWRVNQLKRDVKFKNGVNFSASQRGTGAITLDVLNMYGGITTTFDKCYRVNNDKNEAYLLKKGDILFVRSSVKREGVGWATMFLEYREPVQYCGFIIRARPINPNLYSKFVTYFLQSHSGRDQIILNSSTVTITNISQEKLGSIFIPFPSPVEQIKIADYLDKANERIDQTKALIEQQIKTLTNYRKSLIHECVTGKKRVYFD